MEKRSLIFSILLHGFVFTLLWYDFNLLRKEPMPVTFVPLIVDLKNVQISDKTNLPPEMKKANAKKATPKSPPVPAAKPAASTPPAPIKPVTKPIKDAIEAIESVKPEPVTKNVVKEISPKSQPAPQNDLKSLLATVDKIKKPVGSGTSAASTTQQPYIPTETGEEMNTGIAGGTGGTYDQPLTISEHDLIASRLSDCWNVDAGVEGIEDMIVEIKASVNKDGSISEVRILNKRHDPTFISVAESAKRAVYICDARGDESPFRILAEKYGDHYNRWKEVYVRFNPINGGVF